MVLRQSCPSKNRVDHQGTGDISLDVKISHFENEFFIEFLLKIMGMRTELQRDFCRGVLNTTQ